MKNRWQAALLMATGMSMAACLPSFYANRLPDTPTDATFVEVDGVSLHYRRSGTKAKPVVVLIHGYSASLETWLGVQDALATQYDVIAFDLKGFGWSTRPEGDYSPKEHARLIWRALSKLGVDHATLIGHSWGSSIVLAMALTEQRRVERLGLVSAYVFDEQVPSFFRWSQLPGFGEVLFAMYYDQRLEERVPLAYHDPAFATQERVDGLEREVAKPGAVAAALASARGQDFAWMSPRYGELKQPTLLLWGDDDQVTPVEFGQRLARKLDNSRLVVLPKCGHIPMLEAKTQAIAAIAGFLKATDAAADAAADHADAADAADKAGRAAPPSVPPPVEPTPAATPAIAPAANQGPRS